MVMGAPAAFVFTGTGALEIGGNIAVSERPETPPLDETSFTGMAVARGHITDMQTDGGESSHVVVVVVVWMLVMLLLYLQTSSWAHREQRT